MPRYRTISCTHCGFMQLKRDVECDGCGELTARAKKRLAWTMVQIVFGVLGVVGFIVYVKDALASI